jgi:hypothetical protein
MAVMILVTSLYAFSIINETASGLAAEAQAGEVVNRVSLGVQESLQVAAARAETYGTANSSQLRYAHTISVPPLVQGWDYTVTLDKNFINWSVPVLGRTDGVPTFNAAVTLPPAGVCTPTYIVCTLSGSNVGSKAEIIMTYLYDDTGGSLVNKIEIA